VKPDPQSSTAIDTLRIVGSPQTNRAMEAEMIRVAVRALARRPPAPKRDGTGQLVYPFDPELAQAAVAYLRTPTRVVRDLYKLRSTRLEPLYDELYEAISADERAWWRVEGGPAAAGRLGGARGLSVEVRRIQDFAAGERQVVGTVKNAIIDALARRGVELVVDPAEPDLLVVARLDDAGALVISLDLAGASLSQRGWRSEAGEAPLREHLAAVMLMEARFDPRVDVLIDPLCGAGTIPIEAALAARAPARPLPPAAAALGPRRFTDALFADAAPVVIGQDLDVGVLIAAKANGERAEADVVWSRGDATVLSPDVVSRIATARGRTAERGLILTNPPYGERLSADDDDRLLALYADLARAFRGFRGWRAGVLAAHPLFEDTFARGGLTPAMKKPLANAQIRSYFYLFEL
jgi:23S rRNA G2445 N2-methylase RlmL